MKNFFFWIPTKVYFGNGEIKRVGDLSKTLGKKAFVLASKDTMKEFGQLEALTDSLKKSGVDFVISDDVEQNPKDYDINRQTEMCIRDGCDFCIGLGGGSAMDSAKAVAFLAAQGGGNILDYLAGGVNPTLANTKPALPIVCVTTTAGTGSELTPWWVVTNTKNREKPGTGNDSTQASVAIIDPELMISLPPTVTQNTGIDVLFHAMESYISKVATPFTEVLSIESMKIVVDTLPKVIKNGSDLELRAKMAWANVLAGIAIGEGRSNTVAVHALGHSIGGQTNVPHGLAMASLGPTYLEMTWDADIDKYAMVSSILLNGQKPISTDKKNLAENSSKYLKEFLKKVGVEVRMRDLGVTEDMIEPMTESVYRTMVDALDCSLKNFTREDVLEMYKRAM